MKARIFPKFSDDVFVDTLNSLMTFLVVTFQQVHFCAPLCLALSCVTLRPSDRFSALAEIRGKTK